LQSRTQRNAIVATEPVVFALARMYAIRCAAFGPRVEVFRTVAEGEQWLDTRPIGPRPF
jgi:hypothetical protein